MAAGDITIESQDVFGTKNVVIGTIEGEASATDGGVALSPAKFGLTDVDFVTFELIEVDADEAYASRYDYATDKVQTYECAAGDAMQEIVATTDVHLLTFRFRAIGRK
jgi:hypothetical protein